jgi:dephospho-CoA kinase
MNLFNRSFLIAITGSIGSGKSLVSNWFKEQGFEVHFADKIAHEILNEADVIKQIVQIFGIEILTEKVIDRRKLGEIVFQDPAKLTKLNEIIHPLVYCEMNELILLSKETYLVFEIPLLFENGLQNAFDLVINVSTEKKIRIERIEKRDKLSKDKIMQRMDAQMSDFEKQKLADVNITNNSTESDLFKILGNLLPLIKKLKKKEVISIIKL